eukprot:Nk52_evm1s799 gene=Nk52_evmTU1s799
MIVQERESTTVSRVSATSTNNPPSPPPNLQLWSGFYKKTLQERRDTLGLAFPHLPMDPLLFPASTSTPTPPPATAAGSSDNNSNNNNNNSSSAAAATSPAASSPSSSSPAAWSSGGLSATAADNMVENCIGCIGLPLGLGLNFKVNGCWYAVPMATEEASVIAAASGAAKLVSSHAAESGFQATCAGRNVMTAQIQLRSCSDATVAAASGGDGVCEGVGEWLKGKCAVLEREKARLIEEGNKYCKSMRERGGGVVDVTTHVVDRKRRNRKMSVGMGGEEKELVEYSGEKFLVVHVHVDVQESMGANCVNTVAEGMTPLIEELTGIPAQLRILSNLCTGRMVCSSFTVPVCALAYKQYSGEEVASRVMDAFEFALSDPYRAATHNKGIYNGIDAVALATGQDWRAAEAGGHAFAATRGCHNGGNNGAKQGDNGDNNYRPLTEYAIFDDPVSGEKMFQGRLKIPLAVGVYGGALKSNPLYTWSLKLLGNPSSQTLAMIMASVGLAQNFAALRAMATEGIQRGHMSLHARNIAISAGAPAHAVAETAAHMVACRSIHLDTAREYLLTRKFISVAKPKADSSEDSLSSEEDEKGFLVDIKAQETARRNSSAALAEVRSGKTVSAPVHVVSKASEAEAGNRAAETVHRRRAHRKRNVPFSLFLFEEPAKDGNGLCVKFNVAFQTLPETPVCIEFGRCTGTMTNLYNELFADKDHQWLNAIYDSISSLKFTTHRSGGENAIPTRENARQVKQLKILSILMNVITNNLSNRHAASTKKFLAIALMKACKIMDDGSGTGSSDGQQFPNGSEGISRNSSGTGFAGVSGYQSYFVHDRVFRPESLNAIDIQNDCEAVKYGLPLLLNMWQVFEYEVRSWVGEGLLADLILDEQCLILTSLINLPSISSTAKRLEEFMPAHIKRFQMTMMFLCDAVSFPIGTFDINGCRFILDLGSALEYRAAVFHDIANADEDVAKDRELRARFGLSLARHGSQNSAFDQREEGSETDPREDIENGGGMDDDDEELGSELSGESGSQNAYRNIACRNAYLFWLKNIAGGREHSPEALKMFEKQVEEMRKTYESRIRPYIESNEMEAMFGKEFIAKIASKFDEFKLWKTIFHNP